MWGGGQVFRSIYNIKQRTSTLNEICEVRHDHGLGLFVKPVPGVTVTDNITSMIRARRMVFYKHIMHLFEQTWHCIK